MQNQIALASLSKEYIFILEYIDIQCKAAAILEKYIQIPETDWHYKPVDTIIFLFFFSFNSYLNGNFIVLLDSFLHNIARVKKASIIIKVYLFTSSIGISKNSVGSNSRIDEER